jgi:PAS domain S-box-containing protein
MKKILTLIFIAFLYLSIPAQNLTDTNIDINFPVPDSITQSFDNQLDADKQINDLIIVNSELQSQKLLKNLFLAGFIFMSVMVIFLFYINNVKIKQILKLVKIQEQQVGAKDFEIERLSIILNNTMDGIAIIDKNNKILWHNSSFLHLFGIKKENIDDAKLDFFSSENTDIQELINKAKNDNKPVQFTFDIKNKNGDTVFIQRRIIPISDSENVVENFAIIDTDYTALKLALKDKNKDI